MCSFSGVIAKLEHDPYDRQHVLMLKEALLS